MCHPHKVRQYRWAELDNMPGSMSHVVVSAAFRLPKGDAATIRKSVCTRVQPCDGLSKVAAGSGTLRPLYTVVQLGALEGVGRQGYREAERQKAEAGGGEMLGLVPALYIHCSKPPVCMSTCTCKGNIIFKRSSAF